MLDLFTISKGLKAGQDAYSRGQKEQADQYWSEIENSLKLMASAQDIRESASLSPLKAMSEQALAFQREQAGKYSEQGALTRQAQRPYDIEHEKNLGESTGRLTESRDLDVQQKERNLKAELGGYEQWKTTTTNPDKTPDQYLYETKIKPKLEEQQFKTQEAGIKLKYVDRQANATLKATLQRADNAGTDGYKVSQWADDIGVVDGRIDTLYNRNVLIDRTLAYLSKSSSMADFISAVAAQTDTNLAGVAGQVTDAASLELAKQSLLNAKKTNLDRISYLQQRKNQLNKLAGIPEEPTIQINPDEIKPTADQIIQLPLDVFTSDNQQGREQGIRSHANQGTRKIELLDSNGKVSSTIDITSSPSGKDWICKRKLPDGTVQVWGIPKQPIAKPMKNNLPGSLTEEQKRKIAESVKNE